MYTTSSPGTFPVSARKPRTRYHRAGRTAAFLGTLSLLVTGWAPTVAADSSGVLPDPIVSYEFTGDDGMGAVVNQGDTNFGDAHIVSATGNVPGVYEGDALVMDGGYYIDLPDGILAGQPSATISMVVENDTFSVSGSNPWSYLWSLGSTGFTAKGSWSASTHNGLYSSITPNANGSAEAIAASPTNLSTTTFQTLTATIDASTMQSTLYIDGKRVAAATSTVTPDKFGDHTHNVIGESRYPGVGDAFFHGKIKSFTVYGKALNDQEILATMPADIISGLLTNEAAALSVPASVSGDFTLPTSTQHSSVAWSSSNTDVISVDAAGMAAVHQSADGPTTVTLTAMLAPVGGLATPAPVTKQFDVVVAQKTPEPENPEAGPVSSHDPAIVRAHGMYYIFGTHRSWAKSTDLVHWTPFTNNLSTNYTDVLGEAWNAWSGKNTNNNSKIDGNMWAPEVVWNPVMNKWCMYLSLNGGGFPYQKSMIVLLTADDIEGDWSYVGPVVYSGFQASDAAQTDVYTVLGEGANLDRYSRLDDTGINAIDPSVVTDADGSMWMSFGSWFGGVWMIELDPATGLRQYSTGYATVKDSSDAYYGDKIAGGYWNSGEGAAVVKKGDWWYLFVSYGELGQTGGYQIREFRSHEVTGPYLDQNGNSAIYTSRLTDNSMINRGLRVLGSVIQPGETEIRTSQGGNSILIDDDGAVYNVFHTRFVPSAGDTAQHKEHEVRVQQMLTTSDGWLVSTPYTYTGHFTQASSYARADVAGTYSVVVVDPTVQYEGGGTTSAGIARTVSVTLGADGKLTGNARGTWSVDGTSVTLRISASKVGSGLMGTYTGTFAAQPTEKGGYAMVFSAVGGDTFTSCGPDIAACQGRVEIWGTRSIDWPETSPTSPEASPIEDTSPDRNVFFQAEIGQQIADIAMTIAGSDQVLAGDWDGDGVDTLALRTGHTYTFLGTNRTGSVSITVDLSDGIPVVGDFNGDGLDDLAIREAGSNLFRITYAVAGSIPAGTINATVTFGKAADTPIAGDWDGDGKATLGVHRGASFMLTDTLTSGVATKSFTFGRAGDGVVIGDWDADGIDTIALTRGETVLVKNTLGGGNADLSFAYGRAGDQILAGDWFARGSDTFALYRH